MYHFVLHPNNFHSFSHKTVFILNLNLTGNILIWQYQQ